MCATETSWIFQIWSGHRDSGFGVYYPSGATSKGRMNVSARRNQLMSLFGLSSEGGLSLKNLEIVGVHVDRL